MQNISVYLLWIFMIDRESMPLTASYRLVASGVDSNSHSIMTDSLIFNIIMA